MVDFDNESPLNVDNLFKNVAFRPLKENEIKLLFALWQLTYIDNELQVTSEMIKAKSELNENQFSIALRDIWKISKECYIKSTRGAIGKLAVYSIIDNRIISTSSTAKTVLKLHSISKELRVKQASVEKEIIKEFGSNEKFVERLRWLILCGYLRKEEKETFVFCERFICEINWINMLAG